MCIPWPLLSSQNTTDNLSRPSTPRFWPSVLLRPRPPRPMLASAVLLPTTRLKCLALGKEGGLVSELGLRLWHRDVKARSAQKVECIAGIKMDETPEDPTQ